MVEAIRPLRSVAEAGPSLAGSGCVRPRCASLTGRRGASGRNPRRARVHRQGRRRRCSCGDRGCGVGSARRALPGPAGAAARGRTGFPPYFPGLSICRRNPTLTANFTATGPLGSGLGRCAGSETQRRRAATAGGALQAAPRGRGWMADRSKGPQSCWPGCVCVCQVGVD